MRRGLGLFLGAMLMAGFLEGTCGAGRAESNSGQPLAATAPLVPMPAFIFEDAGWHVNPPCPNCQAYEKDLARFLAEFDAEAAKRGVPTAMPGVQR